MAHPPPNSRPLHVKGRGLVPVPALDFHDDDPPPAGWRLRSWRTDDSRQNDDPTEADATRTLRAVVRWPIEGMTPAQLRRHRRNVVIIAAIEARVPLPWVAEVVGVKISGLKKIRAEYRGKYQETDP